MPNRAPAPPVASAPTAKPPSVDPDPLHDPAIRKQVEAGRQVAFHLLKGVKIRGLK